MTGLSQPSTDTRTALASEGAQPTARFSVHKVVDAPCPVLDLFSNPTPIRIAIA